jgi:hypothetical protein
MSESLEDVRRDIENTRVALGEKISLLENKIETTANTTLNPAYYVRTRPWPTLGVVTLLGCWIGRSLRKPRAAHGMPLNSSGKFSGGFASAAASVAGVVAAELARDFLRRRKDPNDHKPTSLGGSRSL